MKLLLVAALVAGYCLLLPPLQRQLEQRAVAVKLGYTPAAEVLKLSVAEHRQAVAGWTVLKVLFYYGSTIQAMLDDRPVRPEYFNMFSTLQTALKLDPYNMDAYYFAQGAFTWEVGRIREVNNLLDYGMKYRTWDWYLPYFAGFNEAYFLKDYARASAYMQKAAELSGNPLFTRLATRYFYEAGRTDLGLAFLDNAIRQAKEPRLREIYQLRRQALLAVRALEAAIEKFHAGFKRLPQSLRELVTAGFVAELPADPYGGEFYLDPKGKVRTTSNFALPQEKKPNEPADREDVPGSGRSATR